MHYIFIYMLRYHDIFKIGVQKSSDTKKILNTKGKNKNRRKARKKVCVCCLSPLSLPPPSSLFLAPHPCCHGKLITILFFIFFLIILSVTL